MSRSALKTGLRVLGRLCGPQGPSRHSLPPPTALLSLQRRFKTIDPSAVGPGLIKPEDRIHVTFHCDGQAYKTYGKDGDTLLDVVVDRDIPLDGFGACEGTLACSTCHCVFSQEVFDALPEPPIDEELDMLDLAYDLRDTSRLGCQIVLRKELDGLEVEVPAGRTDARL